MEKITLSTPITSYQVASLILSWELKQIGIELTGASGQLLTHTVRGTAATTLMKQLNKANLSTKSLHRRLLEYLVANGILAGTVSGTPD